MPAAQEAFNVPIIRTTNFKSGANVLNSILTYPVQQADGTITDYVLRAGYTVAQQATAVDDGNIANLVLHTALVQALDGLKPLNPPVQGPAKTGITQAPAGFGIFIPSFGGQANFAHTLATIVVLQGAGFQSGWFGGQYVN